MQSIGMMGSSIYKKYFDYLNSRIQMKPAFEKMVKAMYSDSIAAIKICQLRNEFLSQDFIGETETGML